MVKEFEISCKSVKGPHKNDLWCVYVHLSGEREAICFS